MHPLVDVLESQPELFRLGPGSVVQLEPGSVVQLEPPLEKLYLLKNQAEVAFAELHPFRLEVGEELLEDREVGVVQMLRKAVVLTVLHLLVVADKLLQEGLVLLRAPLLEVAVVTEGLEVYQCSEFLCGLPILEPLVALQEGQVQRVLCKRIKKVNGLVVSLFR